MDTEDKEIIIGALVCIALGIAALVSGQSIIGELMLYGGIGFLFGFGVANG